MSKAKTWIAAIILGGTLVVPQACTLTSPGPVSMPSQTITDQDITVAVETRLMWDKIVPSHRVNVETEDGIVTLSGSVDNILAKERASQVAQTILGVVSVVNTLTVTPPDRTDREIHGDVKEALHRDPVTDVYEIEAGVANGIVRLWGEVESWQEKQFAARVAKGVRGVKEVRNDITVTYRARSDHEIQTDVEGRLEWDVWVDSRSITVDVKNGTVILSGKVGSGAERSRAHVDAWVTGVTDVDMSGLRVAWSVRENMRRGHRYVRKSDQDVKRAVESALRYDPRVRSSGVDVEVDRGDVVLTGVVNTLRAREAAEEDTRNTAGVWDVENYIRVRLVGEWPTDGQIAEGVEEAFRRDPLIEPHEILVSVYNGRVRLRGTVDSKDEKILAEDIASRVKGVARIENDLTVGGTQSDERSDWELRQDIQDQLWWSPFVDGSQILIEVTDGTATLSGMVNTWTERRAAADCAYEAGATQVRNKLRVKDGGPLSLGS